MYKKTFKIITLLFTLVFMLTSVYAVNAGTVADPAEIHDCDLIDCDFVVEDVRAYINEGYSYFYGVMQSIKKGIVPEGVINVQTFAIPEDKASCSVCGGTLITNTATMRDYMTCGTHPNCEVILTYKMTEVYCSKCGALYSFDIILIDTVHRWVNK